MIPYRLNPTGSGWPREGSFGVFLTSSGAVLSSSIIMSGAAVPGADCSQTVYSHGTARETVVSSGGRMLVSSGGRASDATISSGGSMFIYSGAVASGAVIHNGAIAAVRGGTLASAVISSGGSLAHTHGSISSIFKAVGGLATITVNPDYAVADVTSEGGQTLTVSSGVLSGYSAMDGDSFFVQNGGRIISGLATSGTALARFVAESGGTVSMCSAVDGGRIQIGSGGTGRRLVASNAMIYASYGGLVHTATIYPGGGLRLALSAQADNLWTLSGGTSIIGETCTASSLTVSSGGRLIVSSGGTALEVTSKTGAVIVSSAGAYITYA